MSQRFCQKSKLKGRQAEDISINKVRALIGVKSVVCYHRDIQQTLACNKDLSPQQV